MSRGKMEFPEMVEKYFRYFNHGKTIVINILKLLDFSSYHQTLKVVWEHLTDFITDFASMCLFKLLFEKRKRYSTSDGWLDYLEKGTILFSGLSLVKRNPAQLIFCLVGRNHIF